MNHLNVEEKRARQGRMSTGFSGKGNRATRSSSNGSRNGPNNGHSNKSKATNNYTQSNDNNGSNGTGFIERRKTDVHENQMNETGSHRKSNIRRS